MIRTGRREQGDHRYGCARRWRRGPTACANALSVRRDLAEVRIIGLLQSRLYTPENVQALVEKVNAWLRARVSTLKAEQAALLTARGQVRGQLERLRQFILGGDTSARVREWLAEAEREEARLLQELARLDAEGRQRTLQVHPGRVSAYLDDLLGTLRRGGVPARQLLQGDIERIVIPPMREVPKPYPRAEIVTTGRGVLERVAFVVAGAGFEPATFGL